MSWTAMSQQAWKASQTLARQKKRRASVNRSYYAAFSALTREFRKVKMDFPHGYEHPPHRQMGKTISKLLTHYAKQDRDDLKDAVRRLYKAREDADYRSLTVFDDNLVRSASRDSRFVLESTGVL